MKKLVMAILVMAGLSATAQDHNIRGKRHAMKDLTPDQTATLQTKKMTLSLDLNESQQSKMKSILTEDAKTRKSKMEGFRAHQEEGSKMTAEEKYTMQNERLDYQIAHKKEMKSLLTNEQFEKWKKMNHSKKTMHKSNREGRKKDKRSLRD
ncbi:hypothetical protein [Maribacter sp. ACAM166]|uniref:hypothetical protein n=1 Tax=Maribacter sp. ACAM166 TaxID=2508996 RepID=UPI0010FDD427|nr:hypothetical protein [Maribacter sp. ACAM166]TLP74399.1 hypothetical protein ES765_16160 [Maribacter sp. ACAM166]